MNGRIDKRRHGMWLSGVKNVIKLLAGQAKRNKSWGLYKQLENFMILHRVLAMDDGQFLAGGGDDLSIAGEQVAAHVQLQVLESRAAIADMAGKVVQFQLQAGKMNSEE